MKRILLVFNRIAAVLLSLLYPERCVFCDEVIGGMGEVFVCNACRRTGDFVGENYCLKCGKRIENAAEEYCRDCALGKHFFDRGRVLYVYNDAIRESIYRLKYKNRRRYAIYFGDEMAKEFAPWLQKRKIQAIIPIPLHKSRRIKRGYNQAQLLAERISEKTGIPVRNDLIFRVKKTEAQKLKNARERQNNLKNAFKIMHNDVKLEIVVLVDDIYTTGSTMDEAARVLKASGIKEVYCISLASGVC